VARRRYRSEAISTAGQQERPHDPVGDDSLAQPVQPIGEYGKSEPASQPQAAPESAPHFATGLGEQMRAQRAFAQQQRIAQLHGYIDQMPNLSPAQRQWLHNNPLGVFRFDLLNDAHLIAGQRHIPVDSPEYFHFLSAMLNAYGHLPPQQMAQPAPAPSPSPMPPPIHIDVEKTEHDHEPEAASVAVSAPVSRGAEHYSADYEPGEGSRVTLSKAEREHAEAAGVSVEEYAKQKLKMMKLKKAKVIKDE